MSRGFRWFFFVLLLTQLPLSPARAGEVIDAAGRKALADYAAQIKRIGQSLNKRRYDGEDIAGWTRLSIKAGGAASLCIDKVEDALETVNTKISALGEPAHNEARDVHEKRRKYQKEKAALDKQLARCNLLRLSSEEVAQQLKQAETDYFRQKYLQQGETIVSLVHAFLSSPVSLFRESGRFLWQRAGFGEMDRGALLALAGAVTLAAVAGFWLRQRLRRYVTSQKHAVDTFTDKLWLAVQVTLAAYLPWLLITGVAATGAWLATRALPELPFITQASLALLIYFASIAVVRFLFAPQPPARPFLGFTPHIAISLSRRLHVLALLGLVGYLAFYTVFSQSLNEQNLLLLRQVFSLFFVLNVIWTLAVIIRSPRLPRLRWVSWLVIVLLLLTLLAEMAGYRDLAFAVRGKVLFVFILFMLFVGLAKLFTDLFDHLDAGDRGLGRRLHRALALEAGQRVPGLVWLRLLTAIMLWSGFTWLFINTWDYSGGIIETLRNYLVNGFEIGEFRIVPGRIFWAILVFAVIVMFSGWARSQLENNWLKMTGMDAGARDALVTITGYVLFILAAMAALAVAGFDFGNITIIAGALSVGIGFGLQNIVNNFVSGLILLFERPVRKGDWIVVGGTEGVVKDIQIRSTRIQTFDRADVIVPNSELISNQVTNWVLSSDSGRAKIPVGVAYGSDTEQVRELLLKVAEENDNVAKVPYLPRPKVLFRAFGDSALEFELRVFLHNVDSRLSVISDLNFAIDKAFREAGIEIPFPQRDLHLRSAVPLTASAGAPNSGYEHDDKID